jgi:hypothetical protein
MAQDDPLRTLTQQMFQDTSERTTAWVVRILLLAISGLAAVAMFLAGNTLEGLKADIANSNKTIWTAVSSVTSSTALNTNNIGILQRQMQDYISTETSIDTQLQKMADDHEARIRVLERGKSAN